MVLSNNCCEIIALNHLLGVGMTVVMPRAQSCLLASGKCKTLKQLISLKWCLNISDMQVCILVTLVKVMHDMQLLIYADTLTCYTISLTCLTHRAYGVKMVNVGTAA